MNAQIKSKLEMMRADYNRVKGYPFNYFFCPILFRDEDTPLCKAHIINRAFSNSSRKWIIQRKDVDAFYGSNFESEFFAIQYLEKRSIDKTLTDKSLYKRFSPRISLGGKPVDYFITNRDVPKRFTPIIFEDHEGQTVFLGLKLSPEEFLSFDVKSLEIGISKDIRIPALVSLIKAAHLTLFDISGYYYALSAGGIFVGRDILGKFYLQNENKTKDEILDCARPFFREYIHMVRPFPTLNPNLQGTITDGILFLCKRNNNLPWAMLVFIKTSLSLHAVMVPILDRADNAVEFYNFLQNENEIIEGSYCQLIHDHWEIKKYTNKVTWPKKGILYPES